MDEHNDGPHLESWGIFCSYQAKGEDMTFESMAMTQRKRIINQLEDFEKQHQVTLDARETSAGAAYADLVVTIVAREASAGAGEVAVGGGNASATRAGPSKAPAASPVARTVAQAVTGAATAAYLTILKLSMSPEAKVVALKGLLGMERDEHIVKVFSGAWDTRRRWSLLAKIVKALEK
jgi:hypothetical protein